MIPLLIAGAAALGSGIAGAIGSANAAASQKDSAQKALEQQWRMFQQQQGNYQQQRQDSMPWLDAGRESLGSMLQMTRPGFDASSMASDPGYQFRMAEGQKALERSASARGMLSSGGALKGLARYSQGVASEEFGNRFNRLASLSGAGQAANQNLGALGAQQAANMGHYADSASNLYGAMGNADAAGAMGTANAFSGAMGSLGNMATLGMMMPGGWGGGGGGGIPTQPGAGGMLAGRAAPWSANLYGGR